MQQQQELIAELRELMREIRAETRRQEAAEMRSMFRARAAANDDCCCGSLVAAIESERQSGIVK